MYLSPSLTTIDEGNYFSYPVSNKRITDNLAVCTGRFSGSGSDYQMYRSNCMDLMVDSCSTEWSESCDLYQANLNKSEQELFQQSLSRRQTPLNSYNSCHRVPNSIVPLQSNMKGINPIVVGDTEIVMPLSCPTKIKEGFKHLSQNTSNPQSLQQQLSQQQHPSQQLGSPQPFSPDRPPIHPPIGTPQPFVPVQVQQQSQQQLGSPQPFSPDRPPIQPPIGTPQPFVPVQVQQQSQQQLGSPQPFSPDRPPIQPPIGTPQPFVPVQVQQQVQQYVGGLVSQPQEHLQTPIPFYPGPMQPQPFAPMMNRQSSQQMPQATVPPHPILDVEPVIPAGTPVPFYPIPQQKGPSQTPIPFYPGPMQPAQQQSHQIPVQSQQIPVQSHQIPAQSHQIPVKQKSVSFEEDNIEKLLSGGEECQNACSISKILQK